MENSPLNQLTQSELEFIIQQTSKMDDEFRHIKEQHLQVSELFNGVIDLLPTAIWVVNEDGSVYLQNSKSKDIPMNLQEIDMINDHDTEIELADKNYILQIAHVKDKTIVAATDNTRVKRNERLVSMGKMAAHLAHEIRNPIGSVSILASTLFNKVDFKTKPVVLEIKKSIWRVERIVKATLLFSKGVTLNPKVFRFDELAEELNMVTNNYSYSKDIVFNYQFPQTTVKADFDLLGMVLQNMIINAIDAIEECDLEEGSIDILHTIEEDFHVLEILDSGKDFDDRTIVFEAFKSTKTKGHGLGLALSKQIIDAHNGDISLSDIKKGFVIKIPAIAH